MALLAKAVRMRRMVWSVTLSFAFIAIFISSETSSTISLVLSREVGPCRAQISMSFKNYNKTYLEWSALTDWVLWRWSKTNSRRKEREAQYERDFQHDDSRHCRFSINLTTNNPFAWGQNNLDNNSAGAPTCFVLPIARLIAWRLLLFYKADPLCWEPQQKWAVSFSFYECIGELNYRHVPVKDLFFKFIYFINKNYGAVYLNIVWLPTLVIIHCGAPENMLPYEHALRERSDAGVIFLVFSHLLHLGDSSYLFSLHSFVSYHHSQQGLQALTSLLTSSLISFFISTAPSIGFLRMRRIVLIVTMSFCLAATATSS